VWRAEGPPGGHGGRAWATAGFVSPPGSRPPGRIAAGVRGAAPAGSALVAADPADWLPSRRLAGPRAGRDRRYRELLRLPGRELYPFVVVDDVQRPAVLQQVAGRRVVDLHPQALPPDEEIERQPGDPLGQARREADRAVPVAQAREATDQRDPGAGQRCDMHAVAGVVLQVVQVHEGGLAQVVEGQA